MKNEPALIRGLVGAVIALLVSFGLLNADALTPAQIDAIGLTAAAAIPFITAVLIRRKVVPVEKVTQLVDEALYTEVPHNARKVVPVEKVTQLVDEALYTEVPHNAPAVGDPLTDTPITEDH